MRADCGSGRPGRPQPAPLSEAHLGGGDGEGGVGQLLVLRLLPGQTCCIFHLFELVGKLEKGGLLAVGLVRNFYLEHFECFFFLDQPDAAAAP